MSRLINYLNEENNVLECMFLLSLDDELNEMSDENFQAIKRLGDKMGMKVSKSHSLFSLLKKFGSDVGRVLALATKYHFANVFRNTEKANEIKKEMDKALTRTTKKDVLSFFMQLDKNLLSLTAIPRHILQSFFGVEISTYNHWKEEKEYIIDALGKIERVLDKMEGDHEKEMELLLKLKHSFVDMKF